MSGSAGSAEASRSPGIRQGLALTLVFVAVLAAGAVSNAWGGPAPGEAGHRPTRRSLDGADPARAAAETVGDRWAARYSAAEFADYSDGLDGRYVGVGLWLRNTDNGVEISGVQRGSPADRQGVRAGELLNAVDGLHTVGRPVTEVVAQLRGSAVGSPVALTLDGGGKSGRRTVTLRRAVLDTDDVSVRRVSAGTAAAPVTVTEIRVAEFSRGAGDRIARSVADAVREARPGHPFPGIILDLRGNTGGLLSEAQRTASAFLDGGPIARITDGPTDADDAAAPGGGGLLGAAGPDRSAASNGSNDVKDVKGAKDAKGGKDAKAGRDAKSAKAGKGRTGEGGGNGKQRRAGRPAKPSGTGTVADAPAADRDLDAARGGDTSVPLVVLVDGGTMSAAELVAGALQDRGRAVVIGSRTFGKGSIQEPSVLSDGSVIEHTVGHYRTPSGRKVDGVGLRPDVSVPVGADPEAAERQALTVLAGLGGKF